MKEKNRPIYINPKTHMRAKIHTASIGMKLAEWSERVIRSALDKIEQKSNPPKPKINKLCES